MTDRYAVLLGPPARPAIAVKLPESVAAAVVEFCFGPLAEGPRRVGKPLHDELAGLYGARRGEYRVIYQIDDDTHTVHVLDIAHRGRIYERDGRSR